MAAPSRSAETTQRRSAPRSRDSLHHRAEARCTAN